MILRKVMPIFSELGSGICTHFFYKQPHHFRVEPRVATKIPKMRLKVALKLLSIFGIEAQVAQLFDNLGLKCL